MKFYIASSLKNIENVRRVAENLKTRGFQHTYDWTTHSNVDTITKLRNIGHFSSTTVMKRGGSAMRDHRHNQDIREFNKELTNFLYEVVDFLPDWVG